MGKKQTIESLEAALGEANQRAHRYARDNDAYRSRESARMRAEHAEKQRKLKQEERAEKLKRIENIGRGLLPMEHVTEWAIISDDQQQLSVEVTVPLSAVDHTALQEYLDGRREREARQRALQDGINKMRERADRAIRTGIYSYI